MRRLIYDARAVSLEYTGLGRYTAFLLFALLDELDVAASKTDVLLYDKIISSNNIHYLKLKDFETKGLCELHFIKSPAVSVQQHYKVHQYVNSFDASDYFYTHFDMPWGIKHNKTFVVHDLFPLILNDYIRRFAFFKKIYFKIQLMHSIRQAERIIAVSKTTARDIVKCMGNKYSDKIIIAPEGPTIIAANKLNNDTSKVRSFEKYLLYVGDRRPHKNLFRVIKIYQLLVSKYGYNGQFFLVGAENEYVPGLNNYIKETKGVVSLGNLSDEDVASMYRSADALMFLSQYEGFGLPVIEAATIGCKIIVSDGGALAEIAPNSACIIRNAMSIEDAADAINKYIKNGKVYYDNSYLNHYSWTNAARLIFPKFCKK